MFRSLLKIVGLAVLTVVGGLLVVRVALRSPLQGQLDAARAEVDDLRHAVDRLTAERRVAQLLVTDRTVGPDGVPRTTLLVEEYAAADPNGVATGATTGQPIAPLRVTIVGDEAHLDATVISFEHGLVAAGDPLRGRSIALFTRLYGNHQTPADGTPIDTPERIGQLDRGTDARVTAFQRELWGDLWRLAEDPAFRRAKNVRAAGGQGIFFPAKPGLLYTVTLAADGGLSYTAEPLRGIYRDALRAAGSRAN